jgi:predicted component of type VI protein secretion system
MQTNEEVCEDCGRVHPPVPEGLKAMLMALLGVPAKPQPPEPKPENAPPSEMVKRADVVAELRRGAKIMQDGLDSAFAAKALGEKFADAGLVRSAVDTADLDLSIEKLTCVRDVISDLANHVESGVVLP